MAGRCCDPFTLLNEDLAVVFSVTAGRRQEPDFIVVRQALIELPSYQTVRVLVQVEDGEIERRCEGNPSRIWHE